MTQEKVRMAAKTALNAAGRESDDVAVVKAAEEWRVFVCGTEGVYVKFGLPFSVTPETVVRITCLMLEAAELAARDKARKEARDD